jgi:hypothetical protein
MADEKKTAHNYDKTSSKRQTAHLARLAETGGKPVRVDTSGEDLAKLDDLVANGYAPSRVEAYRRALREAHSREAGRKDT